MTEYMVTISLNEEERSLLKEILIDYSQALRIEIANCALPEVQEALTHRKLIYDQVITRLAHPEHAGEYN